jgi:BirA family biotin operon repressor/biotin-[acetyl-CoA-carboxylase] ligase
VLYIGKLNMAADYEKQVIKLLADGGFHSGQAIADKIHLSRTAVWKKIQSIKEGCGLTIHAVSGKGYRIPGGLDLLEEQNLTEQLQAALGDDSGFVRVFNQIDSTNQYMLDCIDVDDNHWGVCIAEMQSKGRGRRGRQWYSPYGKNIQLSVGVMLNMPMTDVSGLSIATGVVVAGFLSDIGVKDVALKWPNDIHVDQKKIAGLLLEVRGEAEGPVKTVLGVGLNLDMSWAMRQNIDQPFTDVKHHLNGPLPSRTTLVASLVTRLYRAIEEYKLKGLSYFLKHWERFDSYLGQNIVIASASSQYYGRYIGLDEQGRLLLKNDVGIKAYSAGEVSLRRQWHHD